MKTLAILQRDNFTFTITEASLGYYLLHIEKDDDVEIFKSPDLSELINKLVDECKGNN